MSLFSFCVLFVISISIEFVRSDDDEICDGWMRQEDYCSNSQFKEYCPDAAEKNCDGSGAKSAEADDKGGPGGGSGGGGGGESLPRASDDSEICPKWKEFGPEEYCGHNRDMLKKYCPETAKECGPQKKGGKGKKNKKPKYPYPTLPTPAPTKKPKTTKATSPPSTTAPEATTTKKKLTYDQNYQECCKANGVQSQCMGMCMAVKDSTVLCVKTNDCEADFHKVNYCGTNGQDTHDCCKANGVPDFCSVFCYYKTYPSVNRIAPYKWCVDKHMALWDQCAVKAFDGEPKWEARSDWKWEVWTPGLKQAVVNLYCK